MQCTLLPLAGSSNELRVPAQPAAWYHMVSKRLPGVLATSVIDMRQQIMAATSKAAHRVRAGNPPHLLAPATGEDRALDDLKRLGAEEGEQT